MSSRLGCSKAGPSARRRHDTTFRSSSQSINTAMHPRRLLHTHLLHQQQHKQARHLECMSWNLHILLQEGYLERVPQQWQPAIQQALALQVRPAWQTLAAGTRAHLSSAFPMRCCCCERCVHPHGVLVAHVGLHVRSPSLPNPSQPCRHKRSSAPTPGVPTAGPHICRAKQNLPADFQDLLNSPVQHGWQQARATVNTYCL